MTLLPIVARELKLAARRNSTYWSRVTAALVGMLIVIAFVVTSSYSSIPSTQLGKGIFMVMAWVTFLFCLLAGTRITSDCISEEKRDGTLGLLFLTDLKGYDIIFGKLTATSLRAFHGILALLPVFALPLLMGGVSMREFLQTALVLINTLFFSLAVGIAVSTYNVDQRRSAGTTLLFLLFITLMLPMIIGLMAPQMRPGQNIGTVVMAVNPATSLVLVFARRMQNASLMFLGACAAVHFMAWCCLALACRAVGNTWQERPTTKNKEKIITSLRSLRYGTVERRRSLRRKLLATNAIYWLGNRDIWKLAWARVLLGCLFAIWVWIWIRIGKDVFRFEFITGTVLFLMTLLKLGIASEAGTLFGENKRSGAMELWLSTRMGIEDLIQGQLLALRRIFLPPALAVIGFTVLLATLSFTFFPEQPTSLIPKVLTLLAGIFMLIADLATLSWVGMWLGLIAKNAKTVPGSVCLRVLVIPWVLLGLVTTIWAWVDWKTSLSFNLSFGQKVGLWFMAGILVDIILLRWSRRSLYRDFRNVVMQRFEPIRTYSLAYRLCRWFAKANR